MHTFGTGLGLVGSNRYDAIKVRGGMCRVGATTAPLSAHWEGTGEELSDNFEKDCNDSRGDGV